MSGYDHIIAGAGCAGLSLLVNMIHSGEFGGQKILLVDRAPKTQNDRTWCFWEKEAGLFEPVVYRSWDKLWFHGEKYSSLKDIRPYRYKMIRGIDFYNYCFGLIGKQPNITVEYGTVEGMVSDGLQTFVTLNGEKIPARYIFNSILPTRPLHPASPIDVPGQPRGRWNLLQHFKGWVIGTERPFFRPEEATLMDFRVSQQQGSAFVYTMPLSDSAALVEYTVLSENLLQQTAYEEGLRNYLHDVLHLDGYTVMEEEFGVIPMTDHPFGGLENHILHIGTAGGQTKASSGYTFQFIQQQSREIVRALSETGVPSVPSASGRFRFYDKVLLNVLASGKLPGEKIFTRLFSGNRITDIFSFLDNGTRLTQELRIIGSLPTGPFLRAGLQELTRRE